MTTSLSGLVRSVALLAAVSPTAPAMAQITRYDELANLPFPNAYPT
jgi:hypothetical protein